eukprot:CAMPEP_0185012164 /NCGR_PEP_ID=MMETSP1098-20130426/98162_1 /TAXON_ID=89044 /ORGANISM="Spumella elongata, Strain CCAP 955/1" /LENGTH=1230 /DNA_ID=CAMNT_0027541217 /DNA_START=64 /DNA_END=3756 /DNA_ORIENTATION=+
MGVPKFFRWVTNRYPSILTGPLTGPPTEPNVDNLYFDMNGIIHQCSHTDDDVSENLSFDVVCQKIFDEINRIMDLVRPQQLIYIAVDGVAPRAKLNQQRARRFRSSHDRLQALRSSGASAATAFDSNCITPGTEFMARLTEALRAFIAQMLRTQATWHGLKVHFSGSEVPGEGEHKIVSFIRSERLKEDYQPNLRHCILGADADMIMLALATHEPYFLVLRDVLDFKRAKKPFMDHHHNNAQPTAPKIRSMNYIRINVLREYLVNELLESLNPAEFEAERIIDDFVFLTFLVGNDFLPHLPAINIGDDAFDVIFDAYKTVLASEPGYLVHEGVLDVERLELIFTLIGVTEKSLYYDQVLMEEQKQRQQRERKEKVEKYRAEKLASMAATEGGSMQSSVVDVVDGVGSVGDGSEANSSDVTTSNTTSSSPIMSHFDTLSATAITDHTTIASYNNTSGSLLDREEQCKHDYYVTKFHIDIYTTEGQVAMREIVSAYLMGLQWCLQYYSIGCTSWEWFYPYHYGPFLQDMTQLDTVPAYADTVKLGNPLQPFQQLLACLPAASSGLLPSAYHALERKEKVEKYRAEKLASMAATEGSSLHSSVGDGSLVDGVGSNGDGSEANSSDVTSNNTTSSSPIMSHFDTLSATATATTVVPNTTTGGSLLDREEQCKHDYYVNKFHIDIYTPEGQVALREIVSAYLMGLQWCLQYYSIGCTSWEWFYPYHYGPFLQDMTQLNSVPAYADTVKLGNPLQPFQQLLACLPAASSGLLPSAYHALMNSPTSPLHDFYPTEFETDLNGKKQDYEAVVILPFIDINLLKQTEANMWATYGNRIKKLTSAELARNTFGAEYVCSMRTVENRHVLPSGLHGDTLCIETIPFALVTVAEMKPFAAALTPGTANPVTSIPGFPSRTELLEVVNYTKGYGKSKNSRKNIRSRANCYAEETEDFPMPGAVGNGSWSESKEGSSVLGTTKQSGTKADNTDVSSTDEEVTNHVGGVIRLVVDARTSQILQAIAQQVQMQSPYFHPLTNSVTTSNCETAITTEPSSTYKAHIDLPLCSLVSVDNLLQYESILLNNNILTKAGAIFSTIKCALQPVALLSRSGVVSVKFVDVSHLNQLEDFLLQRLLGNEMLDDLNRKSVATQRKSDNTDRNSSNNTSYGKKNRQGASGVGFTRSIVIGSYTGEDSERFMDWLNKELYKLSALLTNLSCGELQYVVCDESELVEVVKECVSLRV